METKGFFQFKILIKCMSLLALSASFKYLCFESTAIINILIILMWGGGGGRQYTSESDVHRRQILTYKDGPRDGRVYIVQK